MKITYEVAMEVAGHEAIIRQAYKDSVGKWTWSVGLTSATGHVVERYIGKPQSLEHCLRVYVWALDNYADAVRKAFKGRELTQAQFAAALSFHWNTGAILKASWVKSFLAGNYALAKKQFMLYKRPPEVIERRKKERNLFFNGKWSNNGTMTEYTRLTKSNTPDWGSGKRINVEKILKDILADRIPASDKVIVEREVLPPKVEEKVTDVKEEVKKQSKFGAWLSALLSAISTMAMALAGMDWQTLAVIGVALIVILLILLFLYRRVIEVINKLQEAIND